MVSEWSAEDVHEWLQQIKKEINNPDCHRIDDFSGLNGKELLTVTEAEVHFVLHKHTSFRIMKKFMFALRELQNKEREAMERLGHAEDSSHCSCVEDVSKSEARRRRSHQQHSHGVQHVQEQQADGARHSDPELRARLEGTASTLKPEVWKAFLSLCYVFLVTWITAVVMVIVHDKVPDMKKYPPLPDLFLDNVPHIPWAFDMCEITGSLLMAIWVVVLLFHKHRFILLRRFFALSGTVFLLRCITMLITSLSVPGGHLKCAPRSYPSDVELYSNWSRRLSQAYAIWTGAGMSVRGVRTCGDYMFSGHTVALTLLNFFITEYTSRSLYLLHIATWLMNMFGIFFILAAHEHYSIDVFIAFYITSRLFLYYHTLSNNQALMQGDSLRTRIWFPLLSFFESEVDGIVPNEYESPLVVFVYAKRCIVQLYHDLSETSVARFAGNSLRQQATMVDFSVARTIDNLKKVLITADGSKLGNASDNRSSLSDKNIQASVPVDNSAGHMHYCADAACRREKIFHNSSQNSTKKDK